MNYQDLKHNENGMPTWDGFLGPVLQVATVKPLWQVRELSNAVIDAIHLPKQLAELRYQSKYKDLIALNRVTWAISDLSLAGLLDRPERGYYKISAYGQKVLDKYGLNITRELVHSSPKYVEYEEHKHPKIEDDVRSLQLTEAQINNWFEKNTNDLANQLLTKLQKTDPFVFEKMMVDLLTKMGYKGTDGEAFVTQKSNDGGIDGVLNQDPLGLRKVLVQVKRYEPGNTVGRQIISQFHGDLDLQGADNGVFITTSSFTAGAEKAAKTFNIKLINGDTLTQLMIEYKVGVQVKQSYELIDIDDDFFEKD